MIEMTETPNAASAEIARPMFSGEAPCYNATRKEVIGDCVLYQGDCAVILPQLPNFDLILTDPPYGIGETGGRSSRGRKGDSRWMAPTDKDYGENSWDVSPVEEWLMSLLLTKGLVSIIFGGNYYALPATKCLLIWDKESDGKNGADCEIAWTNLPNTTKRIRHLWDGFRMAKREDRQHPTQKPLLVMEWCLTFAPESRTVCDPFMGSGTTGVACARQGKHFVGIEREPKYFDIACERIATAYRTRPRLFDSVKPSEPIQQGIF